MTVRKSIKVYINEEEKNKIETLANMRGISMSKLMLAVTLENYQEEISGINDGRS